MRDGTKEARPSFVSITTPSFFFPITFQSSLLVSVCGLGYYGWKRLDFDKFPAPAALGAGANPAARDVFKRATDSRAAWLACSASFCAAILESIGDANRLAIADPATDTLH